MTAIVEGLFGLNPDQLVQQRQAALQNQSFNFAQLDPQQQSTYGIYSGASQLGGPVAGMMGMVNPQEEQAKQMQQVSQGADLSSPEGLMAVAQKFQAMGMPQQAYVAVSKANELKASMAKQNLENAQALEHLHKAQSEASPFGKIDPSKYTQESVQKYMTTKNQGDLEAIEATSKSPGAEFVQLTKRLQDPTITPEEKNWTNARLKYLTVHPENVSVQASNEITPDAIERAAVEYRQTGKMPQIGMGNPIARGRILNKAAELAKAEGATPQEDALRHAANAANQVALNAISKDLTAIRPFKVMLDTNAKVAIDLAEKVSKTNPQLANRTLNWINANVTGDNDTAEYLAQIHFVSTEAARVLNNPRLVGQLTDSARKEMAGIVNGNMTLGQTKAVLARIQSDGQNRVSAMENEANNLKKNISTTKVEAPKAVSLDEYLKSKGH